MTMSTHPVFRAATPADVASVERLLTDSKLPIDGVREMLTSGVSHMTVAEDPSTSAIVAVAGLEVCCEHALLRSVAVRSDWQSQGLGNALIKRVVCEAEERGIQALYLLTLTAEHYFPRFGFAAVSRETVPAAIAETIEFKSACPASAVAMIRSLVAV